MMLTHIYENDILSVLIHLIHLTQRMHEISQKGETDDYFGYV